MDKPTNTGMYCECGGQYVHGKGTGRTWSYDTNHPAYQIPDNIRLTYCVNCKHLVLRKSEEDLLTQMAESYS